MCTQASEWRMKNHPFLKYKCKQGVGMHKNEKYTCTVMELSKEQEYYKKSINEWRKQKTKQKEKYNAKKHHDWADVNNFGVTHFRIN